MTKIYPNYIIKPLQNIETYLKISFSKTLSKFCMLEGKPACVCTAQVYVEFFQISTSSMQNFNSEYRQIYMFTTTLLMLLLLLLFAIIVCIIIIIIIDVIIIGWKWSLYIYFYVVWTIFIVKITNNICKQKHAVIQMYNV